MMRQEDKPRFLRLLLCALLLLVFSFPGPALARELSPDDIAALEEALEDQTQDLPISENFRVLVTPGDLSVTPGLDEDWVNILLLGTDTGDIRLNYGRTDTMIIMSVNRYTGKVRLASLVRDMYVNIPYYNKMFKINAANAFGGPLLAVKTVNEAFSLNIRSYVSINFSGFTKVIDSLGGVEIVLSSGEAGALNVSQSAQPRLLNGEQALHYVRIRHLDDNFGRNERQRKLLSSLFNKMLSGSNLTQAMGALTEVLRHMATNMSINEMMTLVLPVFSGMEDMDTAGFPAAGDFRFDSTDDRQSIISFDQQSTITRLHDYIYEGIQP